jgi:hypothetical protein
MVLRGRYNCKASWYTLTPIRKFVRSFKTLSSLIGNDKLLKPALTSTLQAEHLLVPQDTWKCGILHTMQARKIVYPYGIKKVTLT